MIEKCVVVVHKIIAILAVIASCVFFALSLLTVIDGASGLNIIAQVILSGACVLVSVIWVWLSFQVRCKEYNYNDKVITVYAGYFRHTLKVDGRLASKYNQWLWGVNVELSATLDENTRIVAKIQPLNTITFRLYSQKYLKSKSTPKETMHRHIFSFYVSLCREHPTKIQEYSVLSV